MQCRIYAAEEGAPQTLSREWYGAELAPPFEFSFHRDEEELIFRMRRDAAAIIHPTAAPGAWQEELWRYDVAEFFIATPGADRYLEFNLCPNGAWWAAAFTEPRVPLAGFDARALAPRTSGMCRPEGWAAEAHVPLALLRAHGWELSACRMAVCAVICRAGAYTYLTSSEQTSGRPDFHRPWDWEAPLLP